MHGFSKPTAMPEKVKVLSLVDVCVKFITENLEHWCKKPVSEVIHVINPELANSSFDELPLVVLKKILDVLEQNYQIEKKFLELLLSPQLDSLDFSNLKGRDVGDVLYLASIKCTNLKKLQLRGALNVGHYMIFFLPKFEKLQVLDIASSKIEDHCLQLLGVCCKNLRELNVLGCSKITDEGVKGLCLSVDYYGKEDSRLGQCKLIEKLATSGTRITNVGKKILLDNLHDLKIWDGVHFGFLSEMFKSDPYLLKNPPSYSFTQLELKQNSFFSFNSLRLGVSLCPFLNKIKIKVVDGLMDSDILSLLSLKNLYKLIINGFDEKDKSGGITFIGGIIPLLKCFGCSLAKLNLSNLHDVNILLIAQLCPNLRSLKLKENWSYSTADRTEEYKYRSNQTNKPILQSLEELILICDFSEYVPFNPIPPDNIVILLSSPSLTHVSIVGCGNLTDEVLQEAAKTHNFEKLVNLEIFFCASMTKKGIDIFLTNRNPLKKIELLNCLRLTKEDVRCWKRKKKEENWDLNIDVLGFEPDVSIDSESDASSESENDSSELSSFCESANDWSDEY